MESESHASALQMLVSMVTLCFGMEQFDEAEHYAQSGSELATGTLNPALYAHLLERKAAAQLAQGKQEEAIASYEHSRGVAEYYLLIETWEIVLEQLIALYSEEGLHEKSRERQQERSRMSVEKAADPARNSPAEARAPA
jgi:hypothetical protein